MQLKFVRLPCLRLLLAVVLLCPSLSARADLVLSATNTLALNRISAEVLYEAFGRLGVSFSVRLHPARRALVAANHGDVDGALHRIGGLTGHFPGLIQVPVAINVLEPVAFSMAPGTEISHWSDLAVRRVGIVRGVVFHERNTAGMDVEHATSLVQLLRMLEHDRIEVAVSDRLFLLDCLQGRRDIYLSPVSLAREPLYLYLHVRHSDLVDKLAMELHRMQQSGRLAGIRARFADAVQQGKPLPPFPVPVLGVQVEH